MTVIFREIATIAAAWSAGRPVGPVGRVRKRDEFGFLVYLLEFHPRGREM